MELNFSAAAPERVITRFPLLRALSISACKKKKKVLARVLLSSASWHHAQMCQSERHQLMAPCPLIPLICCSASAGDCSTALFDWCATGAQLKPRWHCCTVQMYQHSNAPIILVALQH